MDPQRWAEIERLYHLAREREVGEREKLLAEARGGDECLRREVESLSRPPEGQDFLEAPALEVAARALAKDKVSAPPSDLTGRTIAHYRVLEKIGEGGMGEVFLAKRRIRKEGTQHNYARRREQLFDDSVPHDGVSDHGEFLHGQCVRSGKP